MNEFGFLSVYVFPKFIMFFDRVGAKLPVITKLVFGFIIFLKSHIAVIAGSIFGLIMFFVLSFYFNSFKFIAFSDLEN